MRSPGGDLEVDRDFASTGWAVVECGNGPIRQCRPDEVTGLAHYGYLRMLGNMLQTFQLGSLRFHAKALVHEFVEQEKSWLNARMMLSMNTRQFEKNRPLQPAAYLLTIRKI